MSDLRIKVYRKFLVAQFTTECWGVLSVTSDIEIRHRLPTPPNQAIPDRYLEEQYPSSS